MKNEDILSLAAAYKGMPKIINGSCVAYELIRNTKRSIRFGVVVDMTDDDRILVIDEVPSESPPHNEMPDSVADVSSHRTDLSDVERARSSIRGLDENKLHEIARYIAPPTSIVYTIQALCCLLKVSPSSQWSQAKQILRQKKIIESILQFDVTTVQRDHANSITSMFTQRSSVLKNGSQSETILVLQKWIVANCCFVLHQKPSSFSDRQKTKPKEVNRSLILRSAVIDVFVSSSTINYDGLQAKSGVLIPDFIKELSNHLERESSASTQASTTEEDNELLQRCIAQTRDAYHAMRRMGRVPTNLERLKRVSSTLSPSSLLRVLHEEICNLYLIARKGGSSVVPQDTSCADEPLIEKDFYLSLQKQLAELAYALEESNNRYNELSVECERMCALLQRPCAT